MKSPIKGKAVSFAFPAHKVVNNTFLELGDASRGRYHVILFAKDTADYSQLSIDVENKIEHTADCIQYFLRGIEGSAIGSVIEVRKKTASISHNRVSVAVGKEVSSFQSPLDQGSGGVIVYLDDTGNALVVPSDPVVSEFMVVD